MWMHFGLATLLLLLGSTSAQAQLDRLYPEGASGAISGTIATVTKNGVQLKTGSSTKDYSEEEIRKITFQGDPAELTKGREFALDGQYEAALEELKALDVEKLKREVIKTDAAYYLVLVKSKLALAGQGDRTAAITEAINFVRQHSESYHFYSVAKLLGDLALSTKSYDKALLYYGSLANAPSTESKIESRYLTGVAMLEKGDNAGASKAFNDVANVSVESTEALRLKILAKAGQAVAQAREGKGEDALKMVNELVEKLNATDIEMAARIYNAQGAAYEALGDNEGALLSYLHTHMMFSGQPDAHARALSRLVELWPSLGHADRAAEARQELQQRYPGYAN